MSKTVKILIALGASVVGLLLIAFLGLFALAYFFADRAGMEQSKADGMEFGKTTDYAGCESEGISRIRNLGLLEINESVKAQYFVRGCLETSRPSPANYCENVPTEQQDIWAGDRWKDARCREHGWQEMSPNCRAVLRARLEFCAKK